MQQTVLARKNVHESAVVLDARDLAVVDLADFRLGGDFLDPGDRGILGFLVFGVDAHRTVVFDIDRGACLFHDALDGRATLADDVADLLRMYLEGHHCRRVIRQGLARDGDDLVHLAQNVQPRGERLLQRGFHDLLGDAVDLDVHLQRGDAVAGARNLEVHVAEMILVAKYVGEHRKTVSVLHQSHGNARDRRP